MNGLYNLGILIWYPPKYLLFESLFDLCIRKHIFLMVTIQHHPNLLFRYVFVCEIFQLPNYVAYRRHFSNCNQIKMITFSNNGQILFIERRRKIGQDKLITRTQEAQSMGK